MTEEEKLRLFTTRALIQNLRGVDDGDEVTCRFCGKKAFAEEMEPISGGDWGCTPCVDGYMAGEP